MASLNCQRLCFGLAKDLLIGGAPYGLANLNPVESIGPESFVCSVLPLEVAACTGLYRLSWSELFLGWCWFVHGSDSVVRDGATVNGAGAESVAFKDIGF